jgi:hypothetical protein
MNTKNSHHNDPFRSIIQKDNPEICPNPATQERLNYYFRLQHSKQKVYSNNFLSFFSWVLSGESLILKTGLVFFIAAFFVIKSPITQDSSILTGDSCTTNAVLVDTNAFVRDTCYN